MMHAKSLKSSWTVDAGSSVECTCLSRDGGQIAVGTETGAVILGRDTGREVGRIVSDLGPVTGLAFGRKGRIIVGSGGSVRLYRIESQGIIENLDLLSEEHNGSIQELNSTARAVRLCLHPEKEVFGAVCETGRIIYVLDIDLQIRSQMVIPSKCGNICELHWLSSTTLLATSTDGLHVWRYSHSDTESITPSVRPSLTLGQSIGLVTASASPQTSALAGASRDGVVYIWTVEEDATAKEHDEALSADLRSTLKEYPTQVHPMCWDKHGKYLATADGPEATVWEVPRLLKDTTQSTVCSGHEATSRIVQAAFQEDGPMLATAADDGTVLIFNTDRFQPGKHSKPTACIHAELGKEVVRSLLWTAGGRLVVGLSNGKLGLWGISQPVPPQNLSRHSLSSSQPARVHSQRDALEVAEAEPSSRAPQVASLSFTSADDHATSLIQVPSNLAVRKMSRPVELPKSGGSSNGLTRQRSATKGPLQSKMSNASMLSEKSSSFRSRDGSEFRRDPVENKRNDERSFGSSLQNQQSLLSGDSLSDRSRSLQDSQPAVTRNSSLERGAGLSPSLWQSIQNVGRKKSLTQSQQGREPSGWGQGLATSLPNQQVPMQMAGHMPVPYAPGGHGQMSAAPMMMVANPAMGQYVPSQPGFPPHLAHMPMLTHPVPPGVVDGNGMHPYPQHMMYMQVPSNMSHQAQWPPHMLQGPHPGAMQGPPGAYMYMVHPSQSGMQNAGPPVGVLPMARASSVPDDQIGNWKESDKNNRGPGEWVSISDGFKSAGEDVATNSISLPDTMTEQWRKKAPEMQAKAAEATAQNGKSSLEKGGRQPSTADSGPQAHPLKSSSGDLTAQLRPGNDTIYVGNLAQAVTEQHLQTIFQKFGTITHTQVIRDKLTMISRGFGFVSFLEPNAASNAIADMNGQKVFGMFNSRSLKVSSSNRPAQGR